MTAKYNLWRVAWIAAVVLGGINGAVFLAKQVVQSRTPTEQAIVGRYCASLRSQIPRGASVVIVLADPQKDIAAWVVRYAFYGYCHVDVARQPIALQKCVSYDGAIYCDTQFNLTYFDKQAIIRNANDLAFISKGKQY
jgi:hypothetical protein